jgi:hypothetical protein
MFLTRLFARARKILSGSRVKLHDSKFEDTVTLKRLRELMEIANSNRTETPSPGFTARVEDPNTGDPSCRL